MPGPKVTFDRDDIAEIIEVLVDRLVARGASVRLRVAGGAAIMLQFDRELGTTHIDAAYGSSTVVEEVVAELAEERALQADWLNNDFRGFLSDLTPMRTGSRT
jgi:hypothetical protein